VVSGTLTSAAGGLALLQPGAETAPRRLLLAVFLALAVQALVPPSPVATAAAWVLRADLGRALLVAIPIAIVSALAAWIALRHRIIAADKDAGRWDGIWLLVAALLALMVVYTLAQVPSEPLGARVANRFVANLGRPFVVALIGLVVVAVLWRRGLAADGTEARWAQLVLTVGAAGGLSFVLNETGAPELLAETVLDPRLGLLVPFLAAAAVKMMQGNSLTAVLTSVGMTEPLLADLGLADANGRLIAAAAAGAGSIALCHVNDPLFWIAAHLTGLSPGRALIVITGGGAIVSLVALALLAGLRIVL
jgi:H+/gluconate symporter-like permease